MTLRMLVGTAVGCAAAVLFTATSVSAQVNTCSACGPGNHWIDACAGGQDVITDQGAVIGLDTTLDCVADTSVVLGSCGDLEINRSAGVPHTIDTEIASLCLSGGGITLIAGAGLGQGGVLAASTGSIVELVNPAIGDSTFDVFFEVDLGGGNYAYNQTALTLQSDITCVPPSTNYIHPTGCLALFDAPSGGTQIANLVSANHAVNRPPIPTVSAWGLVVMVLLVLGAGTIAFRRLRGAVVAG